MYVRNVAQKYNNIHANYFHATTPLRFDMFSNLGGRLKKLWKGEVLLTSLKL